MEIAELIETLESEWSMSSGFLSLLRQGEFSKEGLDRLLFLIDKIDINEQELIDRRLVSLVWYIPIFMGWQKERLQENGLNLLNLNDAIAKVTNRLEHILGVP